MLQSSCNTLIYRRCLSPRLTKWSRHCQYHLNHYHHHHHHHRRPYNMSSSLYFKNHRWMSSTILLIGGGGSCYYYYITQTRKSMNVQMEENAMLMTEKEEDEWTLVHHDNESSNNSSSWWEWIWDGIMVSWRMTIISIRLSPTIVLYPMNKEWAWRYIRWTLQELGPVFVKLAQWASTRRDLFPPQFCHELSHLQQLAYSNQNNNKKHYTNNNNDEYIHTLLTQSFGTNYMDKISIQEAIGSGCIATVYRGTYNDTPVAIKVLHPHVQETMKRDVLFLQRVASLLDGGIQCLELLHLPRVVENFSSHLQQQLSLQQEYENLQRFHTNFQNSSDVKLPLPIYSNDALMIQELITNAKPISQYYDFPNETKKKLAQSLMGAFLKMMFLDNFVHCDLHPGNILIEEDNNNPTKKNKIVLLDTGMANSLQSQDLQNLKDVFTAVLMNDGAKAGRYMMERAKYKRPNFDKKEEFAEQMNCIVQDFHQHKNLNLNTVQVGVLLNRVLDTCRLYGVEIDPAMANVVISTLVLEGVARSLQPELNLMDFALPYIIGTK